eukprot:TRINITY_DN60871_c0_g1_i1.p1 TRINITY_DN60871_c0_g1~~TRINITY_DN60871_c0_g1_i1.p1  ORF type:complete len:406 (-),score=83.20 TRINITY_DN60871_c0_g1_i1:169-1386(-)
MSFFFFQAEDGIRDAQESRGLGDVYKRQEYGQAVPQQQEDVQLHQRPQQQSEVLQHPVSVPVLRPLHAHPDEQSGLPVQPSTHCDHSGSPGRTCCDQASQCHGGALSPPSTPVASGVKLTKSSTMKHVPTPMEHVPTPEEQEKQNTRVPVPRELFSENHRAAHPHSAITVISSETRVAPASSPNPDPASLDAALGALQQEEAEVKDVQRALALLSAETGVPSSGGLMKLREDAIIDTRDATQKQATTSTKSLAFASAQGSSKVEVSGASKMFCRKHQTYHVCELTRKAALQKSQKSPTAKPRWADMEELPVNIKKFAKAAQTCVRDSFPEDTEDPERDQRQVWELLYKVHVQVITHGAVLCGENPLCSECPLADRCDYNLKHYKPGPITKAVSYTHLTLPTKRIV